MAELSDAVKREIVALGDHEVPTVTFWCATSVQSMCLFLAAVDRLSNMIDRIAFTGYIPGNVSHDGDVEAPGCGLLSPRDCDG
jgi:hypothetical protein